MAMDNGSITSGNAMFNPQRVEEVLDNIQVGLDAVNDKSDAYEYKNADYQMMLPHIQRVEGPNGTKLAYEDWQIFFQDAGVALSPDEYNEMYQEWTLRSKSFETKDGSFTPDFFRKQLKLKKNPLDVLVKRSKGIIKKYQNVFKPNYLWQSILEVPTVGGGYYDKFGALRNVAVDASMLEEVNDSAGNGEKGSVTRDHFRAIANATGAESEDLQFVKEYFNEYIGLSVNDLVMVGTLGSENTLRSVFQSADSRDDVMVNGLAGRNIEGIPFLRTKMLPENIVMFYISTPDEPIIAQLVNDVASFQGLNLVPEATFNKFPSSIGELQGSKYVIEDIGSHLIGRHKVLFLDITPDASHASADRLMQAAGITLLNNKRNGLLGQWKNIVR
jgi:hypothetical protein